MPDWKTLLNTPQKVRTAVLCGLVALATLAAIIVYVVRAPRTGPEGDAPPAESGAVSAVPEESASPVPSEDPIDEARALALADAGVSEEEAEVSREALAEDNGIWVYEFRFRTQAAQYEYKLNDNSGEVRAMEKETFVYPSAAPSLPPESAAPAQSQRPSASTPPTKVPAPSAAPAPAAGVDLEQAKAAALRDAGVSAAQATFTKAEQDYEDSKLVYDIEFHTATHEYEYEILAATGAVYSRSAEAFQTAGPGQNSGGSAYIGMDRAKAIALEHAGLTAAQAAFTHASMDRDHGKMVYELEFRQGRTEYEYKIDAATGRILDHEMDAD